MKNILARGGIEFLAVFLGIALSLWVDDYQEEKEISVRLMDDYKKIHSEKENATTNRVSYSLQIEFTNHIT